jgi:hypothetical protein
VSSSFGGVGWNQIQSTANKDQIIALRNMAGKQVDRGLPPRDDGSSDEM